MSAKSVGIHLGWCAAAVAAFAVGTLWSGKAEIGDSGDGDPSVRPGSSFRDASGQAGDAGRQRTEPGEKDDPQGRLTKLFGVGDGMDLDALAEKAFKDSNPIVRRLAFSKLLESMTPENALELREKLVAMDADDGEWRDFNYSWGALAGKVAFDFASTSEERDLAATLSGWAAANPTEALAMLDNLPESMADQRAELAESVISGLADNNIALATDLAIQLTAQGIGDPDRLIRAVADEALRTGSPVEAAAWAETLGDEKLKSAAMNRIAGAYVRSNPLEAAGWIGKYAGESFAQRAIAEVGKEWGEREPANALGWLETLTPGSGQSEGFRSILGDWEDSNPVAASEYLAKMPPSAQRDAAVSGFARGYAWQDPVASIPWAQDISDPALRQQTLTQVGEAYFRRDPESARSWLESSGLPAEVQQAILNPRRR